MNNHPNGAISRLADEIRYNNQANGFTVTLENIHEKLLLAVGEIIEAQNELRDGRYPNEFYYEGDGKSAGFGIEIADAIIRLLDVAHGSGIDIERMIVMKVDYNTTRPFMHGKQF